MSRPKTAMASYRQKSQKTAHENCPLSDQAIPIISDAEHKAKLCFCHHCTCTLHTCPGDTSKQSPFSSQFLSQYSKDFTKKHIIKELPIKPQEYKSFLKSTSKSKIATTSQSDFSSKEISKNHSFKPQENFFSSRFLARSSYERDFAKWISGNTNFKTPVYPYRGDMIKNWNNESTYKSSFKGQNHSENPPISRKSSIKSIITPGKEGRFHTTSQNFYEKKTNGTSTPDLGKLRNKSEVLSLVNPAVHYRSAYSKDFSKQENKLSLSRRR